MADYTGVIWYLPEGATITRHGIPVTGPLWYRIREGRVERTDQGGLWLSSAVFGPYREDFLACNLLMVDGVGHTTRRDTDFDMDKGL